VLLDLVRREPVQAILMTERADPFETGTAIKVEADDVGFSGERRRKPW